MPEIKTIQTIDTIESLQGSLVDLDKSAKSISFFATTEPIALGNSVYNEMRVLSKQNQGNGIRICLHRNPKEAHHDMIILEHKYKYIRPHSHPHKVETINVISGELGFIHYSENGAILASKILGKGEIIRVSSQGYFFTIPLSEEVIYHEATPGPWSPETNLIFAPWSPAPDQTAEVSCFIENALTVLLNQKGKLRNFVNPQHQSGSRNYGERTVERKYDFASLAKKFDKEYWDGSRDTGYGGYHDDGRWEKFASKLVSEYSLTTSSAVLDIGCGKGYLLNALQKQLPGIRLVGVDVSQYAKDCAPPRR